MRFVLMMVMALGTLAACSGDDFDAYSDATACSLPAGAVSDVLGTDRFGAQDNGVRLPIEESRSPFGCDIFVDPDGEPAIQVFAQYDDDLGVTTVRQAIDQVGGFAVGADGQGAVRTPADDAPGRIDAVWTCGRVTGSVEGSVDDWSADDVEALVEALVDATGCTAGPTG